MELFKEGRISKMLFITTVLIITFKKLYIPATKPIESIKFKEDISTVPVL